jgi:hypothetical protein
MSITVKPQIKVKVDAVPLGWKISWHNTVWGSFNLTLNCKEKPPFPLVVAIIKDEQARRAQRTLTSNRALCLDRRM